ncbi:MAG: hypothetical protein K8R69_01450 [Deltaproteobacteria bacterium]|nr:hypothetical protein [Deltaproteobacteria bacterium]
MNKKFWQRGPVSKILKKPQLALKQTFQAVKGRRPELGSLFEALPGGLASLESGFEVLDGDFPIREGHSRIDLVAINPARELTFIWVKRHCNAETISKLLPDYDWIQKNQALWSHLFPQVLESRSMQMRMWIFALEIDAEVKFLLNYLQGVRMSLFQCGQSGKGAEWNFCSWEEAQKSLGKAAVLPSSPTVLKGVPEKEKPALLSHEEIQDLIGLAPADPYRQEDEITDPFFDLASLQN